MRLLLRLSFLTLFFLSLSLSAIAQPAAIINEWTQGLPSGWYGELWISQAVWSEILVVQDNLNMQNWTLRGRDGGITFSGSIWQSVPAGTLIVIYNSSSRDPILPTDDLSMSDGNFLIVAPDNWNQLSGTCPLLDQANSPYWAYQNNLILKNASNETIHDWDNGNDANLTPSHRPTTNQSVYFSGGAGDNTTLFTPANWVLAAANAATPGSSNGGSNTTWIQSLRNSPPTAPNNASLSDISATSMTLNWVDNSSNETGFNIFTSTDGTNFNLLTQTLTNVSSRVIDNLNPNTHYWYRVSSFNTGGESSTYTSISSWTNAAVPGTPTIVTVRQSTVDVSISNNALTPNPSNTEYSFIELNSNLYVQLDGRLSSSPAWLTQAQWGNTIVIGLLPEQSYLFGAVARNNPGTMTSPSSGASVTLNAATTLPFSEDFSGTPFPPTYWQMKNYDYGITWTRNNLGCNTPGSASMNNTTSPSGQWDILGSPIFNTTGLDYALLTFDWFYSMMSSGQDSLIVIYSFDDFNYTPFWVRWRGGPGDYRLGTGLSAMPNEPGSLASTWGHAEISLPSAVLNQPHVRFAWLDVSRGGYPVFVDNVKLLRATDLVQWTAPASMSMLRIGEVSTLAWSGVAAAGTVNIEINRDATSNTWETLYSNQPSTGSVDWTVTGPASTNAQFRVVSNAQPLAISTSISGFYIQQPTLTFTTPIPEQVFVIGNSLSIGWLSEYMSENVKLEINRNYPTGSWETLVDMYGVLTGNYNWTITGDAGMHARLRLTSLQNSSIMVLSNEFALVSNTNVTFNLDLRSVLQSKLLERSHMIPMLSVLTGTYTGSWQMSDADNDSIYSLTIAQRYSDTIHYNYSIDPYMFGGSSNELVYERGGEADYRSFAVTEMNPTIATSVFDEYSVPGIESGSSGHVVNNFLAGNPDYRSFSGDNQETFIGIDFGSLSRSNIVSVDHFLTDAGGTAPGGIASVASNGYWRISTIAQSIVYSADLAIDYNWITGITDPSDLRVLFSTNTGTQWSTIPSTVDVVNHTLHATVSELAGYWTLGSATGSNSLLPLAPAAVLQLSPTVDEYPVNERPTFNWTNVPNNRYYHLYVWRDGSAEPTVPNYPNISSTPYLLNGYLDFGATYHWKVASSNLYGSAMSGTRTFTVRTVPDLRIADITVPSEASSDQTITVNWTTANDGPGATNLPSWMEFVYFSPDSVFALDRTPLVAQIENISALAVGDSYINTATIHVPITAFGDYYVWVQCRYTGAERGTANNMLRSVAIPVTQSPSADLQTTDVQVSANAFSGQNTLVSWTVENFGSGRTNLFYWEDYIYLSQDSAFDTTDIELKRVRHNGYLLPGETYTATENVKIPDGTIGMRYMIVHGDGGNFVYEYIHENNNQRISSGMNIHLTPPPDLEISNINCAANIMSGQSIALAWTVTNVGSNTAIGGWTDSIFISRTIEDVTYFEPIASYYNTRTLDPEASYMITQNIIVPNGRSGSTSFKIKTDAGNVVYEYTFEDNNTGFSNFFTVGLTPWSNLIIPTITTDAASSPGTWGSAMITVRNSGVGSTVPNAWFDRMYAAQSRTAPYNQWYPLEGVSHTGTLLTGQSTIEKIDFTFPNWNIDTIYIKALADAGNAVYEHTDESDNYSEIKAVAMSASVSDLAIDTISVPASASTGQTITVSWRVTNIGNDQTSTRDWYDYIYVSTDAVLSSDDQRIGLAEHIDWLYPSNGYTQSLSVTLPADVFGHCYLLFQTDPQQWVIETNRANNIVASPIEIALTPPPDLQVSAIRAPATGNAGQPVKIVWTVLNNGIGAAENGWTDGLYLSQDAILDRWDIYLTSKSRSLPLLASESYSDSITLDLPNYIAGQYYLIAATDLNDRVYEYQHEDNNIRFVMMNIILPAPCDLIVSSIDAPATATPGDPVNISYTLSNIGSNPATGYLRTGVYFSSDTTWDINDPLLAIDYRSISIASGDGAPISQVIKVNQAILVDELDNVTGFLPGLVPGDYHIIVKTDLRNNIRETNENNNKTTTSGITSIAIPSLTLGVPTETSLNGTTQKFFRITTIAGNDLRIRLTSSNPLSSNEMYISFGQMPLLSNFDYSATAAFSPNQTMLIPSTQAGDYYLMLQSRNEPGLHQSVTVLAEALSFSVTDITPNVGASDGHITCVIHGAGFRDSTSYLLTQGLVISEAEVIERRSTTEVKVRLNLNGILPGTYNIVARQTDASIAPLANGFTVDTLSEYTLAQIDNIPARILIGRPGRYLIRYTNTSSADIPFLGLLVGMPGVVNYTVTSSRLKKRSELHYMPLEVALTDTIHRGDAILTPMYATNVEAGESFDIIVDVSSTFRGQVPFMVDGMAMNEYMYFVETMINALTVLDMVNRMPSMFDPEMVRLSSDTLQFIRAYFSHLIDYGLIDSQGGSGGVGITGLPPANDFPRLVDGITITLIREFYTWEILWESYLYRDCHKWSNYYFNYWNGGLPCYYRQTGWEEIWTEVEECKGYTLHVPIIHYYLMRISTTIGWKDACFPFEQMFGSGNLTLLAPGFTVSPYITDWFHTLEVKKSIRKSWQIDRVYCTLFGWSNDPNDMTGPTGYGDEKWVGTTETLPYTIRFENDPASATANANMVSIQCDLTTTVNPNTFRLGSFGWGKYTFTIPAGRTNWSQRIDLRDSLGIYVDVTAGLDIVNRRAFWVLETIDPATGLQPNAIDRGFLAVDDSTGKGQGFVTFTVRAKTNTTNDDHIVESAQIIFDTNPAIATPSVSNRIDASAPVTRIRPISSIMDTTSFNLQWTISEAGAGYKNSDIYVSDNSGAYTIYRSAVTDSLVSFQGTLGHTYRFFALGRDNANNLEAMKSAGEVTVTINQSTPPSIIHTLQIERAVVGGNVQVNLTWNPVTTNELGEAMTIDGYLIIEGTQWGDQRYESVIDSVTIPGYSLTLPIAEGLQRYYTVVAYTTGVPSGMPIINTRRYGRPVEIRLDPTYRFKK